MKLVKLFPSAVLPEIVYVITKLSVPFAAALCGPIVQVVVPSPDAVPSVILAVFPIATANSLASKEPVSKVNAVSPS